ncbi:hypothetical protein [uncultured Massilia sp.]|uniref:hypothetical protein n=1 Tax=uncultured Massilia sp. TaxID=169973 RepID=UPI0025FDE3A5|nr:hypothetical protein [uncultured Massilia sp.]
MLRPLSRLSLLALFLAAQAGVATAQQTRQAPPSEAPPKLERIEPGSDVPATTIPSRRGTEIKETRDGGQVTEVEVTSGGSHYYMKPNAQPGNAQTNSIRAPQWKVGEFDLSGKRKATSESGTNAPAAADVPPPPPMPATAGAGEK